MNDPAAQQLRALDIALEYVDRGWAVVPVPFREKGPRLKGWQNLRIDSAEQVDLYFRGPTNIGVILGAASGGLVDIDIDCAEAVEIGDRMLPKTGAVFGRASKRGSHRLYRIAGRAPSMKFDDPVRGDTLIELRGDKQDGSAGFQTVFPGSIHPSGEPIEWADNGEPAVIEYDELKHHAASLAMRALIARYCPGVTTADEARRALAQADPRIMAQIARWHGDVDAARSRNDAVQTGHAPLQVTEREIARVWTASPPSIHESGQVYEFASVDALADCPAWLVEYANGNLNTALVQFPTSGSTAVANRNARPRFLDAATITTPPPPHTAAEEARLRSALLSIPARDRDIWLFVGMGLNWTGWGEPAFQIWDDWSRTAPEKYDEVDQRKTWKSFDRPYGRTRRTVATVYAMAKERGWIDG